MNKKDFTEKLAKDICSRIKGSEFININELSNSHVIKIKRPPQDLLGRIGVEQAISDFCSFRDYNFKIKGKEILVSKENQKYTIGIATRYENHEIIVS